MDSSQLNNTVHRTLLQESNLAASQLPDTTLFSNQSMIMRDLMQFENPTDEMTRRWKQIIEKALPAIDLIDLAAENNFFYSSKRQFAPEYSQTAYLTMLQSEFAIGDYIDY